MERHSLSLTEKKNMRRAVRRERFSGQFCLWSGVGRRHQRRNASAQAKRAREWGTHGNGCSGDEVQKGKYTLEKQAGFAILIPPLTAATTSDRGFPRGLPLYAHCTSYVLLQYPFSKALVPQCRVSLRTSKRLKITSRVVHINVYSFATGIQEIFLVIFILPSITIITLAEPTST